MIEDLKKLPIGEILKEETINAFTLIVAEKAVVLHCNRGTFIHYEGSNEYNLYRSFLDKGYTPEISSLTEDEFNNFRQMMLINPMLYFFLSDNAQFHSEMVITYIKILNELMIQSEKSISEMVGSGDEVLNEYKLLDMVLTLVNETPPIGVSEKGSNFTPPKKTRSKKSK